MIEWHRCEDKLPEDNQECLLYSEQTDHCVGPVPWSDSMKAWCDLFATAEAGHIFMPGPGDGKPSHWAVWNCPEEK